MSQVERFPERQRKDHSELVEEATAPNAAPHVLKLNGEAAAIAKRAGSMSRLLWGALGAVGSSDQLRGMEKQF